MSRNTYRRSVLKSSPYCRCYVAVSHRFKVKMRWMKTPPFILKKGDTIYAMYDFIKLGVVTRLNMFWFFHNFLFQCGSNSL